MTPLPTRLYGLLLRTYPPAFRAEFGTEMQGVFSAALADSADHGRTASAGLCLRELRDWLRLMPAEHLSALRKRRGGAIAYGKDENPTGYESYGRYGKMDLGSNGAWRIEGRKETILAVLPPLIFGLGLTLSALTYGGESFRTIAQWKIGLAMAFVLAGALAIAVGAVIALVKRMPDWGFTWLGAFLMGLLFMLLLIVDELSESSKHLVSPTFETGLAIVLLLIAAAALFLSALRGWQRAGLVSIGMASTLALGMCGTANAAPFYRYDLASLSIVLAGLIALLTYVFVKQDDLATRIGVIFGLGVLNSFSICLVNTAWQEHIIEQGKASPLLPMIVLLAIVLVAGPVVGLITRSVRPLLRRA